MNVAAPYFTTVSSSSVNRLFESEVETFALQWFSSQLLKTIQEIGHAAFLRTIEFV